MKKVAKRITGIILIVIMTVSCLPLYLKNMPEADAAEEKYGYIDVSSSLNVRSGPGTGNSIIGSCYGNQKVKILGTSGSWYKISYEYNGKTITGYVSSEYVNIYDGTYDETYAAKLRSAGFPESYLPALCYLHSKHPDWVFTPYITGLKWSAVMEAEGRIGENLIPISSISSWLRTDGGAYNWETDTYTAYDSSVWGAASKELIAYYIDPRNFLSEYGIFMFEKLSYNSSIHTEEGVKTMLSSTFMSGTYDGKNTYASLFMDAAKQSGVSPYMLAARVIQEQGINGASGSISGTVSGYEGIYNYFNIGAVSSSNPVVQGLKYASQTDSSTLRPWNSIYKAVVGGGIFLGKQYINKGQDTLYLQKFNVTPVNTYGHQYMTNVQAVASEAPNQRKAYTNVDIPIEFSIPVYEDMPESACLKPTATGNPNSYLSSLTVSGVILTPSFKYTTTSYSAVVSASTSSVTISAKTVSGAASVTGTGTKTLNTGQNTFNVVVTAGNGTKTTYKIVITRQAGDSTTVTPTQTPTATPTPTAAPTTVPESITSDIYTISGNYISGVSPNTYIKTFLRHVTLTGSSTKQITDANGLKYTSDSLEIIGTGYKLSTDTKTYKVVVKGDVTADCSVDIKDLLVMKKYLLGYEKLSDEKLKAACINGGSEPGVMDLLLLKKYLLGYTSL